MHLTDNDYYLYSAIALLFYIVVGYVLYRKGVKMTDTVFSNLSVVALLIFCFPIMIKSNLPVNLKVYITLTAVVLVVIYGAMIRIFGRTMKHLIVPNNSRNIKEPVDKSKPDDKKENNKAANP